MALFVAEHRHPADRCPAGNPQMAPFLLQILSDENASKAGLKLHGDAVAKGQHHLFVIIEGPSETAVRQYLGPFAQAGSLDVIPASTCEEVVDRGAC
ncbi:MAG: DUF3303 domain-containing protein [Thermoplasmata archaeon]|nr:DUF3303 domain-containing protein [Thermoplasmata archaeon]